MPAPEKPRVYLVLGAAGSGRREVLADLIEAGVPAGDGTAVLLPAVEPGAAFDAKLPQIERWEWEDGRIQAALPAGARNVFFVTDGRRNPVDQIEAFKAWLGGQGGELARAICVIDCRLAERHPSLLAWFEACVHFADVVLLNRREGVDNKWLSDFTGHFKKRYYPCLFEFVKDGSVKNPALILEPQARRMSHVFDEDAALDGIDLSGVEIGGEGDDEPADDDEEPLLEVDPYFERRLGGRRVKELPDIAKFLGS